MELVIDHDSHYENIKASRDLRNKLRSMRYKFTSDISDDYSSNFSNWYLFKLTR